MPKDVPMANRIGCDYYGAHVTFVDGCRVIDLVGKTLMEKLEVIPDRYPA